ncbi:MAG: metal ABC transporter permease [Betaproteobacteria bacterium]|nr:metal ABC transporter permease [Betaproteobacteria bacterium]
MAELLFWPFVAGLVLTGMHAWFGLHVLARGVVFVDLALAQVAALGVTVAILGGHAVQSEAAYWYALAFAAGAAVLFAAVRAHEAAMQQEAVIGIVYAVSASLGVLALDRAPQGAEHIKQLLIGSILTVTPQEAGMLALLYGLIGALHWILRRPLLEASFNPLLAAARRRRIFLWDVVFYGSFALVVTSSVRIAGVLLVFSYLIVPAAIAGLFASSVRGRLLIAWALGAAITAAGFVASWHWDLPTGPAVVSAFGAAIALVALGFASRRAILMAFCGALALAGLLAVAFPQVEQPWLDAVQEVFLDEEERATRADSLQLVTEASAEIARLRALEQDLRWGAKTMDAEKQERLRQYLAGRSELMAGEQLVLQQLRATARERQRYALGIPLMLMGAGALVLVARSARRKT